MAELEMPALFLTADDASNRQQRVYLTLVRVEYGLLFFAAILTLSESTAPTFLTIYACLFIGSLAALGWRAHARPEQGWYKSRALAESVKTISWRYAMRAEPFDDELEADSNKDFRDTLAALLKSNRQIGEKLVGAKISGPQITESMKDMRGNPVDLRKEFYLSCRVADQQDWYARKAKSNRDAALKWMISGAVCYISCAIMVVAKIWFSKSKLPVEPVIVAASAILGWMQIKKFNELASAYTLTALEIGLAYTVIADSQSDDEFSKAVNEVELVFSREHTQWIARQTAGA